MCYLLNQPFNCGLKVSMAILKSKGSHTWQDIIKKIHDDKNNDLYRRSWDAPASPTLTTTSQRTKHCLICFRDFLLTSSSGHLLSIYPKTFAWSPISSSCVPVSSQVPSLKHCSPSHWGWPPSPLEGGAVITNRHFEVQIPYPRGGLESRLYTPYLLISFLLNGRCWHLIFPGAKGNQEDLWMLQNPLKIQVRNFRISRKETSLQSKESPWMVWGSWYFQH